MNPPRSNSQSRTSRSAFTLVEVMVALSLTGFVIMGVLSFYVQNLRHYHDGTEHVVFIDEARAAEQTISNTIQYARAVSVDGGNQTELRIVQPDLTPSRLYYQEGDTLAECRLMYDPDSSVSGEDIELCRYVSRLNNEPMFQVMPNTTNTTLISFYVGLRPPNTGAAGGLRKSYHGVIVNMTATPRNAVEFVR